MCVQADVCVLYVASACTIALDMHVCACVCVCLWHWRTVALCGIFNILTGTRYTNKNMTGSKNCSFYLKKNETKLLWLQLGLASCTA